MMHTLAADAIVPMSITKVVLMTVLLFGWGKWAALVDKDAMFYYQGRRKWNAIQAGSGALAFLALVMIPFFIVGFLLCVCVLGGAAAAYIVTRNRNVDEAKRWRFDKETLLAAFTKKQEEKALAQATMKFPKPAAGLAQVPKSDDPMYAPHLLFEQIITPAIARRGERLDIAGTEGEFAVQVHIDGVGYKLTKLDAAPAVAMIDYLKAQCGMDTTDRRRKQTGKTRIELLEGGAHELSVSTAGSTQGLTCTILVDPRKSVIRPLGELGMLESQLERLKGVIGTQRGTVLVATPAHQGRTTTLYTLVGQHDPYTQDIHTMESAIEAELEGLTQKVVEPDQLSKALSSLLLREPGVVMVASVPDASTAQVIAKAGAEGVRIYAGIRADDTFMALKMWLKAVGDPGVVSQGLAAIVSQRLMRKLCTVCRQKYTPDAEALRKMNLPADRIKELYKSGGKVLIKGKPEPCPNCQGLGYHGRLAAFEVMVIDDDARPLLKAGDLEQLRAHLRRNKIIYLQEAALAAVVQGHTSISEVMRAMGQQQEGS
ncbi:MAG: hypothetical protein GC162_04130 [Planctomycetes bacterium]|nr:hypothetical protein [Planctomycetota bacterium]